MIQDMRIFHVEIKYHDWLRAKDPEVAAERRTLLRLFNDQLGDVNIELLDTMHFDLHVKTGLKMGRDRGRLTRELEEIHAMFTTAIAEGWIEARYYPPKNFGFMNYQ